MQSKTTAKSGDNFVRKQKYTRIAKITPCLHRTNKSVTTTVSRATRPGTPALHKIMIKPERSKSCERLSLSAIAARGGYKLPKSNDMKWCKHTSHKSKELSKSVTHTVIQTGVNANMHENMQDYIIII